MIIVHTADWHIGKILNEYSLLEDQEYYFEKFAERMAELRPDVIIVAGDLYDRAVPSAAAVRLLNRILTRIVSALKIKTLVVSGNHDSCERLDFMSELLEDNGLYIAAKIETEIKKVSVENVDFYMLPYFQAHTIKSIFPNEIIADDNDAAAVYTRKIRSELDKAKVNILIGHGMYGGADDEVSVGGTAMINSSVFADFDYVALGHLHSRRTAGSDKIIFSGSPLKYSVNEAVQQKSFTIIKISDSGDISTQTEQIKPLRDLRILRGAFEDLRNPTESVGTNDYLFFELTDKTVVLNAVSELKSVYPNTLGLKYINLEFNDGFSKSAEKTANLSISQRFTEFYKTVTEEEPTDEETEYINAASEASTSLVRNERAL